MIPHRLIEIHRGTTRRVETGQPHGAEKYQPQRAIRVFELLVQRRLRFVHPFPVRRDVQALLLHLLNLVLAGRHDQRHIGRLQHVQTFGQISEGFLGLARTLALTGAVVCARCNLPLHPLGLRCPIFPNLVVDLERRSLVNGHHHRFADEAASEEMPHDVLGDRL